MPVLHRSDKAAAQRKDLVAALREEWLAGDDSTASEPLIILEERASGDLLTDLHITVVWSRWSEVPDGKERYAIIMEAFSALPSTAAEDLLRVTTVTALTPDQAAECGLDSGDAQRA